MASWLYNALIGTGPQEVQVVPAASSSSAAVPTEPPPSYYDLVGDKKESPAGAAPRGPPPRLPLQLPALNLLREKRVVLASASPRRKQLLGQLGLNNVEIVPSTFPENLDKSHYAPWEYVTETATAKCTEVYRRVIEDTDKEEPMLVLAADTVICLPTGEILEKPRSEAHHMSMLQTLRDGPPHKVYTAVVAMSPLETAAHPGYAQETAVEETLVTFDKMVTNELLLSYVKTREGADKAGGYAIQGTGSILIEKIEGSPDNVIGLPLAATLKLIEKIMSGEELDEDESAPAEV